MIGKGGMEFLTSAPDSSLRATPFRMTMAGERLTLPIAVFHNGCLFENVLRIHTTKRSAGR